MTLVFISSIIYLQTWPWNFCSIYNYLIICQSLCSNIWDPPWTEADCPLPSLSLLNMWGSIMMPYLSVFRVYALCTCSYTPCFLLLLPLKSLFFCLNFFHFSLCLSSPIWGSAGFRETKRVFWTSSQWTWHPQGRGDPAEGRAKGTIDLAFLVCWSEHFSFLVMRLCITSFVWFKCNRPLQTSLINSICLLKKKKCGF